MRNNCNWMWNSYNWVGAYRVIKCQQHVHGRKKTASEEHAASRTRGLTSRKSSPIRKKNCTNKFPETALFYVSEGIVNKTVTIEVVIGPNILLKLWALKKQKNNNSFWDITESTTHSYIKNVQHLKINLRIFNYETYQFKSASFNEKIYNSFF